MGVDNMTTLFHATEKSQVDQFLCKPIHIKIPNPLVYNGKKVSNKNPGTLGYGLYLFSDIELTQKFLNEKLNKNGKILKFTIFEDVNELDLSNEEHLVVFNSFKYALLKNPIYNQFKIAFKNKGFQSSLEGAMVDQLLRDKRFLAMFNVNSVDLIKAMTVTQIEISIGSYLCNGYEFCIKNSKIIKEVDIYEITDKC